MMVMVIWMMIWMMMMVIMMMMILTIAMMMMMMMMMIPKAVKDDLLPRMFTAISPMATKNPTSPIPKDVVGLWHASGLIVAVRAVVVPDGQVTQLVVPIISL